jgi:methionine-rich copper-binding protein CopC
MSTIRIIHICAILAMGYFAVSTAFVWHRYLNTPKVVRCTADEISERLAARPAESAADKFASVSVATSTQDQIAEESVKENKQTASSTALEAVATLPERVLLDVPFTSQAPEGNWEQPWQDACEEAAMLMIDAYYKGYGLSVSFARDELQRMVNYEQERGMGGSIPAKQVAQVFAETTDGIRTLDVSVSPTITEIKTLLAEGTPVLALAAGKQLQNPYFSGEGPEYHALVIIGYEGNEFITNDPGTRHGEGYRYDMNVLMEALADFDGVSADQHRPVILY